MFSVDDPTFLCERCLKNTHYLEEDGQNPTTSSTASAVASDTNNGCGEETDENGSNDDNESIPKLRKVSDFKAYHYSQI